MPKAIIDGDACKGCGLCVSVCPKDIIEISDEKINARGYHPAHIANLDACIACAACAKMCPDTVISVEFAEWSVEFQGIPLGN